MIKNNIDNLGKKVKEACDDLTKAGGVNECSDADWDAFKAVMDAELMRSKAYHDEMNDIIKIAIKSKN